MKQFFAPLFEALIQHTKKSPAGFHVPGHHYGQALSIELDGVEPDQHPAGWLSALMKLDVTELSATDDLHHPEASIKEAQQLAAATFGADESFFLVGGSTSGNIALLLTICEPGDVIILQRNVHKSIINGLKLAGATAVFLSPQIEPQSGLAIIPSLEQVEEALKRYPEAKAVFLSNPNYYGMGVLLSPYSALIHKYGKALLVDEAHGAHFGFHPELPLSAITEGADAVVQSAHKTLPALTMGAMLHVQGDKLDRGILRQSLAMIQSSSPSFPILASLDISRAMIDSLGARLFQQSLAAAASFRLWLKQNSSYIQELDLSLEEGAFKDPLRVILFDSSGRRSGYEIQQHFDGMGCYAEMADPLYLVLVFGIQTSPTDIEVLQTAVKALDKELVEDSKAPNPSRDSFSQNSVCISIEETIAAPISFERARFSGRGNERIDLIQAKGRLAAELVTPYPPGISILYPGEKISADIILQIQHLARLGAKFQGAIDGEMNTITVYSEESEITFK